ASIFKFLRVNMFPSFSLGPLEIRQRPPLCRAGHASEGVDLKDGALRVPPFLFFIKAILYHLYVKCLVMRGAYFVEVAGMTPEFRREFTYSDRRALRRPAGAPS